MKGNRFSVVRTILRLTMILMLASLGVVAVTPPAVADVGTATVSLTSDLAGQTSGYTVAFTLGASGSLSAYTGEVYLAFPSGTDLPSSLSYTNVLVTTSGTAAMNVGSGGVSVSGQTVTVRMPMSAPGGDTVTITITQAEDIVNPTLSREPSGGPGDGQGTQGYTIDVSTSNANDSSSVASTPYYIYNWIEGDPMAAAMGDTITVTGGGFLPGSSVALSMIGGALGAGPVAIDGTINIMAFGAGVSAAITATDGSGRTASTSTAVTVLPRISVTPTSGNIGSDITIEGRDFTGIPTSLKIGGIQLPTSGLTMSDRDNDGDADDFSFATNIPLGLAKGAKIISVTDPSGTIATTTFTVARYRMTPVPASGLPGTSITLTGAGWPPDCTTTGTGFNAPGLLLFSYSAQTQAVIGDYAIETDSNGAFVETAAIPTNVTPGLHQVICVFSGPTGAISLAYFTVTQRTITLTPSSGPKGTDVTVSDGGLTSGGNIPVGNLTYGDTTWNGSQIILDSNGDLTSTILNTGATLPVGLSTITATDNASLRATGTFEINQAHSQP
ncbi:MAG: hypothetical protein HQ553_18675 [Chloroflexi bacterium]|nr:hypothetical protein [Chloroflexota bacterium]